MRGTQAFHQSFTRSHVRPRATLGLRSPDPLKRGHSTYLGIIVDLLNLLDEIHDLTAEECSQLETQLCSRGEMCSILLVRFSLTEKQRRCVTCQEFQLFLVKRLLQNSLSPAWRTRVRPHVNFMAALMLPSPSLFSDSIIAH